MRESFVGGFLLAAFGEQKCMVAMGAGLVRVRLFGIRGPFLGGA